MKQMMILAVAALLAAAPASLHAAASGAANYRKEKKAERVVTVQYKVNMHCRNCVEKLTDKLSFVKGVKELDISLNKKTVTVRYDAALLQEADIEKIITQLGYSCEKISG